MIGKMNCVRLSKCKGHNYHKECISEGMKGNCLECCMCKVQYGEPKKGNSPPGTMTWKL